MVDKSDRLNQPIPGARLPSDIRRITDIHSISYRPTASKRAKQSAAEDEGIPARIKLQFQVTEDFGRRIRKREHRSAEDIGRGKVRRVRGNRSCRRSPLIAPKKVPNVFTTKCPPTWQVITGWVSSKRTPVNPNSLMFVPGTLPLARSDHGIPVGPSVPLSIEDGGG